MLIIRHIERSGHESVTPCKQVVFDPAVGRKKEWPKGQLLALGCDPKLGGTTGGPIDESGACRYGNGKVFVMSAEGRTVASYDLD